MTLPQLRFPEFQDAPEWENRYSNELFAQISNKEHNSDLPILAITQEYGAIPRDFIDYNVVVSEKSIEGYKVVEVGDFIISLRSFQGGIEYSNYLGICSPAYIILRKSLNLSDRFYSIYFKSDRYIAQLQKNLEGLRDGKMISYKQFSEIQIPFPSLPEQQKIADCLTALDDLITAQNQKLAALKTHKTALMQQLFPAEGQTTPRLRFPEFQDAPEWEEKKLSNLVSLHRGQGVSKNDVTKNGKNECILYGELYTKYEQIITNVVSRTDLEGNIKSNFGDVLIPGTTTADAYGIATASALMVEDVIIGGDINILRPNKNVIDSGYLSCLLSFPLKRELATKARGTTIIHLSGKEIVDISIPLPSLNEQRGIVNCLTALDDLITAQAQQLAALKTHKTALMQQLFPAASE